MAFLWGFLATCLVGVYAHKKRSLDPSGIAAALLVGTVIWGMAGPYAYFILMFFFFSSSLINLFDKDKTPSYRSAWQVFANAGVGTLMAIAYGWTGHEVYFALYIASIGVSACDTWSSEIGKRSKKPPIHIFTFQPMTAGLSGAVSVKGLIAAFSASLIFGFFAWIALTPWFLIVLVGFFSFFGSLIDSMLGVIQVKYRHSATHLLTELKNEHTLYASGLKWLDNNAVNFLANGVTVLLMSLFIF
jgi:uncharacterized protein (TIGR00297 family)